MISFSIEVATGLRRVWCERAVKWAHYLHTWPDPRTRPLWYLVRLVGEPIGCLCFGRSQATRCYQGGLTYGSLADVAAGRAAYDRWEVLDLSRVWLCPQVQAGGELCRTGLVPGFTDRRGVFRSTLASCVIHEALARVNHDYLLYDPPCFVEQPYAIRAVLSYCDTRIHRGTIYRAAGFTLARTNAAGIETHFTTAVAPLTPDQDREIRHAARTSARSRRVRASRGRPTPIDLFGDDAWP